MKLLLLLLMVFVVINLNAQTGAEKLIKNALRIQTESWNRGDIDGFMQTYWKSDSLLFIGKNGVNRGWQATLNNYKKSYPDTAAMGELAFDLVTIKRLSSKYYYVVGKWKLTRTIGNLSGHFDLLFRKIRGSWYIIADHSS